MQQALAAAQQQYGGQSRGGDAEIYALADRIEEELSTSPADKSSLPVLTLANWQKMASSPDIIMVLAHDKIHAWPYQDVPEEWRRVYEDGSLYKAVQMLRSRAKTSEDHMAVPYNRVDWLQQITSVLDQAISLSGAPYRRRLFNEVFDQLCEFVPIRTSDWPRFSITPPLDITSAKSIVRTSGPLSMGKFQLDMQKPSPVIIPGAIHDWPAFQRWDDPNYLLQVTLGGRRMVPVEIGESYVSEGWGQRNMTMHGFIAMHLVPDNPTETGYLAQYDLFEQIPALKSDVQIPDYCWTVPPPANAKALKTAGLLSVPQLDEPLQNAWLGPKGTKTPLHTDPYHNILCQVVGYKYVRLYALDQSHRLYPRGEDENGISMNNTSQIDISRLWSSGRYNHEEESAAIEAEFPLFADAMYEEAILKPGDSLYVPLGYWHYVESLTTSFSVSFWWN